MKNTKYYIVIHSSLYSPHLSKLASGHQFGTFNCHKKLRDMRFVLESPARENEYLCSSSTISEHLIHR